MEEGEDDNDIIELSDVEAEDPYLPAEIPEVSVFSVIDNIELEITNSDSIDFDYDDEENKESLKSISKSDSMIHPVE